MATKKKKSWNSYEDYLQSPEWKKIRKQVHKRDHDKCQLCGNGINWEKITGPFNCHHWRYPSDWSKDEAYNVFLVCHQCHMLIHESGYAVEVDTPTLYLALMSRNIVLDGLRGE